MNKGDFDDIIKKYAEELEKMGQTYGGEIKEDAVSLSKSENEEALKEAVTDSQKVENTEIEPENRQITAKISEVGDESASVNTDPAVNESAGESSQSNATSFALFSAAVFSGEGAYPVEGARIVVYRDDNIYAFLQSNENGRTKKVQLPAFDKENSLAPYNPESNIDYFADVFAEGFIAQRGLLVSSVGGSEILLRVLMIPEEERIG